MATNIPFLLLRVGILLVLQQYFLLQPLPSSSRVVATNKSALPKASSIAFQPNDELRKATKLFEGSVYGVESVAIDDKTGIMYLLDRYGRLFEASLPDSVGTAVNASALEPSGYVGPGRPLGYHVVGNALVICDSLKGLTQLNLSSRQLTILANSAPRASPREFHTPISYADDLDVDPVSGDIYFTDASPIPPAMNRRYFYDTMKSYILTALNGGTHGRLLVYRSQSGATEELATNLWFPNGVALAQDGSYVIFSETCAARLMKYWLTGPRAGETEVLLDGLPGFPDGVSRAADGNFWVALIAPNSLVYRALMTSPPMVRWALAWVFGVVPLPVTKFGMVLKVSGTGEVLQVLQDSTGSHISGVSGLIESGGRLYMGHLSERYVSFIELATVGNSTS